MKKSDGGESPPASELISQRIADLGDWRGATLARMRQLIHEADPGVVEEWKWMGTPVWSHGGIICTGESYKDKMKLTFAKGASLKDPAGLFNASLDGNMRRAIDIPEGKDWTRPPSRPSFARRSRSTVPASQSRQRKSEALRGFALQQVRYRTCSVQTSPLRPASPPPLH